MENPVLNEYYRLYRKFMGYGEDAVCVRINSELSIHYPVLLKKGGGLIIEITNELSDAAEALLAVPPEADLDYVMDILFESGLKYKPDFSYISVCSASSVNEAVFGEGVTCRRLESADKKEFDELIKSASRKDIDLAQISLKDDICVGVFDGGVLAGAASGIRWGERIVDIGVLTRPGMRRKGLGEAASRALCAMYPAENAIMQYRADETNAASVALMRKLGFAPAYALTGAVTDLTP